MSLEPATVGIVPVIVGLVEVAKRMGLSSRYAALLSLVLGLVISVGGWVATRAGGRELFDAMVAGLALGLSASGLYSVARSAAGHLTKGALEP